MSKHTKGPWVVDYDHSTSSAEHIRAGIDGDMYDVASVLCDETGSANANARLIASAPELLDVCRCALADLEGVLPEYDPEREHPAWETLQELRVAIAKATGEQS